MQGLKKGKSSTLKECGEEKAKGALHPKCKSNRRKVNSFPYLHFFSSLWFFFSFFLLLKKKMSRRKHLKQKGKNKRPETGAKSEKVEQKFKGKFLPLSTFYFFSMVFFSLFFFNFLLLEKKKMSRESISNRRAKAGG